MHPLKQSVPKYCGHLHWMCIQICVIALLFWLVLYALAGLYTRIKSAETLEHVVNISMDLQDTVYNLHNETNLELKQERKRKLIVLWTDFFVEGGNWLPSTTLLQCSITECDTTSNRSMLTNSSAVIMHLPNIDTKNLPHCAPSESDQCPLWVLLNKEPPPYTSRDTLRAIQNKVHWTVTYRTDSDVYAPYGKIARKRSSGFSRTDFDPERRLLCWLVNNCENLKRRETFVTELRQYTDVGIYGRCGEMKCHYNKSRHCYEWLSRKCIFYLSLENSNCKDYTTEKLYNALKWDMIPVVMGDRNNYAHLPPGSYIQAEDFSSTKELVEYLEEVVKSEDLYQSYFLWKKYYEVVDQYYKWFCDLCEKLHTTNIEDVKPSRNLETWWFDQSGCNQSLVKSHAEYPVQAMF